jgi:hypothetical protein
MSGPVPLEFDEEDEGFLVCDVHDDDGSLKVPTTIRHRDETSTSRDPRVKVELVPNPRWVSILLLMRASSSSSPSTVGG